MDIETSYALKLFFPNSSFVQIFYEAIANAIDANADEIKVHISADGNIRSPKYLEISISDNGDGFTDERFERFRRLKEPQDPYHKGLGRLVFLNYFAEVLVTSVYDGKRRTFTFSKEFDGSCDTGDAEPLEKNSTRLEFRKFIGARIYSYDDLRPKALKQNLLEEFLPLLHDRWKNDRPIKIRIELDLEEDNRQKSFVSDQAVLCLADIPKFRDLTIEEPTLGVFTKIEIAYVVEQTGGKGSHLTAANIDGRAITLNLLPKGAVPPDCTAIFLFESDLFTGRSDSARQRLVLPEGVSEAALHRRLKQEISKLLSSALPQISERNKATQKGFERDYPHLIGLFETETVGLVDREEALNTAQQKFFNKQKQVIEGDPTDEETFQRSLEVSARSLTEYVLYRQWVIRRLEQTSHLDREEVVHNLIAPRYQTFDQAGLVSGLYQNNVWLLDDKFMTFRTILSEASMKEVIEAITLEEDAVEDGGRPDISMIFSADPDSEEKVDVVVVELKRRNVDEKEATFAGVQLVKRARKLVDHCPNIQRVWYYGIVDINDGLAELLRDLKWVPLYSKDRVFYQDFEVERKTDGTPVPTPTTLISFEAVAADAAARNHTFLELLRDRFKQVSSDSKED